jgi:uncharacterized cofD-like protein
LDVTAVVATMDDGGSSGRLRRERVAIPPGDLRNCLLAMSPTSSPLRALFAHRYSDYGELAGHSVGNLLLAALAEREGCWVKALAAAGEMLGSLGRVLPVSLESALLEAETDDGQRISGESRIGAAVSAIRRVWLEPVSPRPAPGAVEAIRDADLVVLGPGSLFTSLLPLLLVPGIADAVRDSRGRRVLVANLMTQPGETRDMDLEAHLGAIDRHAGPGLVQDIVLNASPPSDDRLLQYAERSARLVAHDAARSRPERFVLADVVTRDGKIRHDSERLAPVLLNLAEQRQSVRYSNTTGISRAETIGIPS